MVEEIHQFFYEIWDWSFPELEIWEISEYSDGIYMIFTTANRKFTISLLKWSKMSEVDKHLMKIKLVHNILNRG